MSRQPNTPLPDQDTQARWTRMDDFIEQHLLAPDPMLQATLDYTAEQGYPAHLHVAPNQGQFLALLLKISQSKRVLELGTFAGYSTLYMAQALNPDGYIMTIEARDSHYQLARENIRRAGLDQRIDLKLGKVADVLTALPIDTAPFDFIFIDADKQNYPLYLELCLRFSRSGTLIVLDNVVRGGEVANLANDKAIMQGLRRLFAHMHMHPRIEIATALQTVGSKGHDGFAILRVK